MVSLHPRRLFGFVGPLLGLLLVTSAALGQSVPELVSESDEALRGNESPAWQVYVRLLNTADANTEVQRILANGMDINMRNSSGRSLLGQAVIQNNPGVVRLLLEYGADPDYADTVVGYTPLHEAALRGFTLVGQILLENRAYPNAKAIKKETPLHLACGNGQFDFVVLLLKAGASVESKDETDLTPLHAAVLYGDPRTVALLLKAGASVDDKLQGSWDLPGGMTPLHIAASDGNLAICKLLVDNGAFINVIDDEGRTPLNYAYANEHHSVVRFLVEKGGQY